MPQLTKELKMWFDVPDDPLKGRIEIKHLKEGEIQEVYNKATEAETVFNGDEGVTKIKQQTSPRIELAILAVTNWENHLDESKKPLKCTPDNIRLFAIEDGFLAFVEKCRKDIAGVAKKKRRAKEKN